MKQYKALRSFFNNLAIIFILYALNYVFVLFLALDKINKFIPSKNKNINIIFILLTFSSMFLLIFTFIFFIELLEKGFVEKGKNFNPFCYIKNKKKYFLYHFIIFLLELIIIMAMYLIFKENFLKLILIKTSNLPIKISILIIFSLVFYLLRISIFSKKLEAIGFKNDLSTGINRTMLKESVRDEYEKYFFKYLISDGIILVIVILFFINLIIYGFGNNPSLLKYFVYNYLSLSFLFFFYSILYMRKKGYKNLKYPFICFLPFGFLFLMFYPAKKEIVEKEIKD